MNKPDAEPNPDSFLPRRSKLDERENQRAPPMPEMDYTERVKIVAYDDGWPEYKEGFFDF